MSTPYNRSRTDPLSLVPFDSALMDAATEAAKGTRRKRSIIRFHELPETVQRMLNAIEPQSYAAPHRHIDPNKVEVFVVLRGRVLLVRFAEGGTPIEGFLLSAEGPVRGAEVPPGAWHCLLSLEPGTVLFEAKQGPYDARTDKGFAPWAPDEDDREAGLAYMARLRAYFEAVLPELAAHDRIEAEEEDMC